MKQRIVLWGALGALAVGAGALVTVSMQGGDGDEPPALPLALAGSSSGASADAATAASAEALTIAPGPTTYVAGDGLPELGGEADAHRLPASLAAGDVADLAEALAVEGEPAEADGAWTVTGDDLTLTAVPVTGTWSLSPTLPAEPVDGTTAGGTASSSAGSSGAGGGGASGAAGQDLGTPVPPDTTPPERAPEPPHSTIVCVTTPCEPAPAGDAPVASAPVDAAESAPCPPASCSTPVQPVEPAPCATGACPGLDPAEPAPCPDDPTVTCVTACAASVPEGGDTAAGDTAARACAEPVPAGPVAGLPGEDAARDQAVALLEATGLDVGGADVEVSGGLANWTVSVEPRFGGLPAPGLAGYVTVGPGGTVESASGPLLPAEALGVYPLLTTAEAVERLNDPGDVSVASPGGPAVDLPASAPATTVPAEQPTSDAGATDVQGLRGQAAPPEGPPMTPGTALPPDGFPSTPTTGTAPADPAAPTTGTTFTTPADPAAPTTGTEPQPEPQPMPLPEPQPFEVVLADAELVYLAVASWDGSGTYLVPGYRFTQADAPEGAEGPTVPAVDDASLAPPDDPPTTEPSSGGDPGVPEPGAIEPAPAPAEPAPAPTTTVDPSAPPTTTATATPGG